MRLPFGLAGTAREDASPLQGTDLGGRALSRTARTSCPGSILFLLLLLGCRTVPELPPVDLSERGWRVVQGQAVWKTDKTAPGLSGELVWAAHRDGRFLLQFLKTPITLVEAQGNDECWRISFPPQGRTLGGRVSSRISDRLGWLRLAQALQGKQPGGDWAFFRRDELWALGNARTGEMIEGYLRP